MAENEFYCEHSTTENSNAAESSTGNPVVPEDGSPVSELWILGAVLGVVLLVGLFGGIFHNRQNIQRSWFVYRQGRRGLSVLRRSDSDKSDGISQNSKDQFEYDAFISFNEQDRSWVYSSLVPELEAKKEGAESLGAGI